REPRRHHAAGEFFKALPEHTLPTIARNNSRIVGEAVERRDPAWRNSLRRRLAPGGFKPSRKAGRVVARRRAGRGSEETAGCDHAQYGCAPASWKLGLHGNGTSPTSFGTL